MNARFAYGSLTELEPGKARSVTLTFRRDPSASAALGPAEHFQFAGEFVVAVVSGNSSRTYSLESVTFDRVVIRGPSTR